MPCRPRSRRRHAQEHHHRKRAHREDSQLILVSRLATYAPLVAVFLLALLMGFAGRVLLPQQHQSSLSVAGALSVVTHSASAARVPVVNRRRLIALSSPFRVNPLAGQVSSLFQFSCHAHLLASHLELSICMRRTAVYPNFHVAAFPSAPNNGKNIQGYQRANWEHL